MTPDPIDTIRRGHAHFNSGELEKMSDVVTDDVAWGTTGTFPGIAEVYRGRAGVVEWAQDVLSAWEHFEVGLDEVLRVDPARGAAVVEVIRGRGRESGVEVESRAYVLYTFRDRRVAARHAFSQRDEVLAAVGDGAR